MYRSFVKNILLHFCVFLLAGCLMAGAQKVFAGFMAWLSRPSIPSVIQEDSPEEETAAETREPPGIPANVTAKAMTQNSISISWRSVPNAESYRIYFSKTLEGRYYEYYTSNTNSYIDSEGIKSGDTWNYKVAAVNRYGAGEQSAAVSATTPAAAPANNQNTNANNQPNPVNPLLNTAWDYNNALEVESGYNIYRLSFAANNRVTFAIYSVNGAALESQTGAYALQGANLTINIAGEVFYYTYTATTITDRQKRSVVYRKRS